MNNQITDMKDFSPNEKTIKNLEEILEDAKAGRIRSVVCLTCWDDNSVTRSWSIDGRNTIRAILAELVLLQHDMVNHIGLAEQDSVIFRKLEE